MSIEARKKWARMPSHVIRICGSSRAFKAEKRRDLRQLEKSLSDFRLGCAFIPDGSALVEQMAQAVATLRNNMRTVNWGR